MPDPGAADIETAVLQSSCARVSILSLGCITQDWQVQVGSSLRRVVLGYRDPADYLGTPYYLGAIVGRVANRIGHGAFELNGQPYKLAHNAPPHTLHGGDIGLGRRNWKMDKDAQSAVRLSRISADGEDGFPGNVAFEITIALAGATLSYEMRAHPDRPTPINLAQHSYYTLGQSSVAGLKLSLPSGEITQNDHTGLPTGEFRSVAGTSWDFREGRKIEEADPDRIGIDNNFVLQDRHSTIRLTTPDGLALRMQTDQPGVQVYSATHLGPHGTPLPEQKHRPFAAICLEPQNFPDAVNKPHFPDPIFTPDRPYAQSLAVTIGPDA